MSCGACQSRRSRLGQLSKAAAKFAKARLRDGGQLRVHPEWRERRDICRQCKLAVLHDGELYCGTPLLLRTDGIWADGCGCPVIDKARDPNEHCPRQTDEGAGCRCKWCVAASEGYSSTSR